MPAETPIWPSQLDHLRLNSDDPQALADFYGRIFGFHQTAMEDGTHLLQGPGRCLVVGKGEPGERPYHGFRVQDRTQLESIRDYLQGQGVNLEESPSTVFEPDAVATRDPDGWLNVFGLPRGDLPAHKAINVASSIRLPGRLQHVVVATDNLEPMMRYYEDLLGLRPSDYCVADEAKPDNKAVAFYRSDPEHHSFAVFKASQVRCDHHAYETTCWNDIRDWADHMSDQGIQLWWGPGRHGPGNNLFFMIKDPHGHQVEISAELEEIPRTTGPRYWPLNEHSLNMWGAGWIRD